MSSVSWCFKLVFLFFNIICFCRGHNGKIYPYLVVNDSGLSDARREERVLQLLRLDQFCNGMDLNVPSPKAPDHIRSQAPNALDRKPLSHKMAQPQISNRNKRPTIERSLTYKNAKFPSHETSYEPILWYRIPLTPFIESPKLGTDGTYQKVFKISEPPPAHNYPAKMNKPFAFTLFLFSKRPAHNCPAK
jgi:hypothetical protein